MNMRHAPRSEGDSPFGGQGAVRCPVDDGFGVYMARAALLSVDTLPKDYTNECEHLPHLEDAEYKTSIENEREVGVYPNPTAGNLTIVSVIEEGQPATFEVFNLLGQNVFSQQLTQGETHSVDISGLVQGIYTARITVNEKVSYSGKLSVLH
jgi:hypothetical protein